MTLDYRNGVSIAEIVVYVPALFIAAFLAIRHGLGQNSGWLFLIIFCLARIIGPSMQLAETSDPFNQSLYTGSAILQNVGLSPLMLATIGLLSRLLDSIHRNKRTMLHSSMFHTIHLIIIVGLILGIVGGVDAADDATRNFVATHVLRYNPTTLNKAGTALFIVAYIAILVLVAAISFHVPHAEAGERRLFFAVIVSLPFILVRLLYSIISTFTHAKDFNLLNGNVTGVLCMALIEELIVVVVYEGTGLTLQRVPKQTQFEEARQLPSQDSEAAVHGAAQAPSQKKTENKFMKVAKYTIIGRIVYSLMGNKDRDIEMQQQR
jgi:hypothetical protein